MHLDYTTFFLSSPSFPPPTLLSLSPTFRFLAFPQNPEPPKTESQEVLKTQGIALFSYPKANTSEWNFERAFLSFSLS